MKTLDFTWPYYDAPEEVRLTTLFNEEKNHMSHLGNVNEILLSYVTNEFSEMKLNSITGKTLSVLITKQGDVLYYGCRDSRLFSHCQHHYLVTYLAQKKKWKAYEMSPIVHSKQYDVTLVTHLTLDQRHHIPHILSRWDGPAVLVLVISMEEVDEADEYVKTLDDKDVIIHVYIRLANLYNNCDDNYIVNINNLMIFKDCYTNPIYPVNLLRAIGVNSIHTTHYMVIDPDTMVSETLYTAIRKVSPMLLSDPKMAFLYPTFTYNAHVTDACLSKGNCEDLWNKVPKKKQGVINSIQSKNVNLVNSTGYDIIHIPSWKKNSANIIMLKCLNSTMMEPNFIAKRHDHMLNFNPYFVSERFSKVELFMQMHQEGYKFGLLLQDYGLKLPLEKSSVTFAYETEEDDKQDQDVMEKLASIYAEKLEVAYSDVLPICKSKS